VVLFKNKYELQIDGSREKFDYIRNGLDLPDEYPKFEQVPMTYFDTSFTRAVMHAITMQKAPSILVQYSCSTIPMKKITVI